MAPRGFPPVPDHDEVHMVEAARLIECRREGRAHLREIVAAGFTAAFEKLGGLLAGQAA